MKSDPKLSPYDLNAQAEIPGFNTTGKAGKWLKRVTRQARDVWKGNNSSSLREAGF